jgi:hypothetical protein
MSRALQVGDRVKVLHMGELGTTLSPARVLSIHKRPDRSAEVIVCTDASEGHGVNVRVLTDQNGHSDYLTRCE